MSFEEFLWALDEEQMANAIRTHADTLETYAAHQAALSLFHRYQIVGGMPAAVNAYRKTLSIEDARVEQREIDETYTADMTDPENGISGVAARKVWRSIPSQLLRSSTKNSSTRGRTRRPSRQAYRAARLARRRRHHIGQQPDRRHRGLPSFPSTTKMEVF